MYKRFPAIFVLTMLVCLLSSGCVDKAALGIGVPETVPAASVTDSLGMALAAEDAEDNESISVESSVSLVQFSGALIEAYGAKKQFETASTAVGRDTALTSVSDGTCDFAIYGGSAEDIADYSGLAAKVIGAEVIHMITSEASGRVDITEDEIFTMFLAEESFSFYAEEETTDTASVSIALAAPGTPSRVLFEDLYELRGEVDGMLSTLIPETANEFATNPEIFNFVAANPETVGVLSSFDIPEGITALTIDGIAADSTVYPGRREIVLAYKEDNAKASDFISFIESDAANDIYGNNGISR